MYDRLLDLTIPSEPQWIRYRDAELYVDPREHVGNSFLKYGVAEDGTQAAMQRHVPSGGTVLDIGAHRGIYSLLLRDRVGSDGRLVSFEPNPTNADILRATADRNGWDNVTVVEAALSDTDGEITLHTRPENTGSATILHDPPVDHSYTDEYAVTTVALDDYLDVQGIDQVDFAKMDIQGAELQALRGASETLESGALSKLLVEVHPQFLSPSEVAELFALLDGTGRLSSVETSAPVESPDAMADAEFVLWQAR
jgi:FkbM family methyltransferase